MIKTHSNDFKYIYIYKSMSLIIIANNCLSKYMLEIYNKNSFNAILSIYIHIFKSTNNNCLYVLFICLK